MPDRSLALTLALVALSVLTPPLAAAPPSPEAQIAGALAAAPPDRQEGAKVLGYDEDGALVTLREGSNDLVCLADSPGDERFMVSCYHQSLEPYMARGRALRAEGVEDTLAARHEEIEAGRLEMPSEPVTAYTFGGPASIFDPETGEVDGGHWVWSIYTPYATEASTGLPASPQLPGAPWIMRPGTPTAHVMVIQPREPAPE